MDGFLFFLLLNGGIWIVAWLITHQCRLGTNEDKVLSFGVIATALIIVIELVLGTGFKRLTLSTAATAAWCAAALTTVVLRPRWRTFLDALLRFVQDTVGFLRAILASPGAVVAAVLLLFTCVVVIFLGILLPPYAWDDIMYHLLIVATWFKTGVVGVFPAFKLLQYWTYYPANAELLFLWNMLPLHNDVLAELTQLPYALLGGVACYGLARKLNISRLPAFLACGLFFLTPLVIIQSKSAYIDVIYGALFLIALNFLLLYRQTQSTGALCLSAASGGIMLGVKGTGVFYLGLLYFLLLLFTIFPAAYLRRSWREILRDHLLFCGLAVLLGSYWYIRNWIVTGSPLYPFSFQVAGITLFPGPLNPADYFWYGEEKFVNQHFEWLWYPLADVIKYGAYSYENGFGLQFLALEIPCLAWAVYQSLKERKFAELSLFSIFFVLLIFFFAIQPFKEPRYLVAALGLGCVAVAYTLSRLRTGQRLLAFFAVVAMVFSVVTAVPAIMPDVNTGVVRTFFREHRGTDRYALYPRYWGDLAVCWQKIDRFTERGDVVAYTYLELAYPLFGNGLKNNVVYLPADDFVTWEEELRRAGVTYVYAGKNEKSTEYHWMMANPQKFIPVYRNDWATIFFYNHPDNRDKYNRDRAKWQ